MRRCAPAGAVVARYGGEEFACLVPNTDVEGARVLAEAMRAAVAADRIPIPGVAEPQRITISAGVASLALMLQTDAARLLRAADVALYQAKHDGRNCVR
jgi:diguanylate cyclase (GGDEF)-like protein